MVIYFTIMFFIIGTILGSFFNVVGSRIPLGQSIMFPGSHCDKCKHKLSPLELIPIFSYIFQGGKCKKCKAKISMIHPLFEVFVGTLFALSYLSYGISFDLIIVLTFVSIVSIVIVSDTNYMIISDGVLIVGAISILIEKFLIYDINMVYISLIYGIIAFLIMLSIKFLGNFMFKKESMGDGDIKLIAFIGLALGYSSNFINVINIIIVIVLGSIIALPISLINLKKNESHVIPFGPFLCIASIIMVFMKFNINWLLFI